MNSFQLWAPAYLSRIRGMPSPRCMRIGAGHPQVNTSHAPSLRFGLSKYSRTPLWTCHQVIWAIDTVEMDDVAHPQRGLNIGVWIHFLFFLAADICIQSPNSNSII